jgi:hypothetical protein
MKLLSVIGFSCMCFAVVYGCTNIPDNSLPPSGPNEEKPVAEDIPVLAVFPEVLDFGEEENSLILTIMNQGKGTLAWYLIVDGNEDWITCTEPHGVITNEIDSVEVIVERGDIKFPEPVCESGLHIYSNGGNLFVPIIVAIPVPRMTVVGLVLDKVTEVPIEGASVTLYDTVGDIVGRGSTIGEGSYEIVDVSFSCAWIMVEKSDYRSRTLKLIQPVIPDDTDEQPVADQGIIELVREQ